MRKTIWIGVLLAALTALSGCRMHGDQGPPTEGQRDIVSFCYSHSGSSMDEMYSYEIIEDEETGELKAYYEFMNGNITCLLPVDDELMQALEAIVAEHDLRKWDGFDKSNSMVLDGSNFFLKIRFSDESGITASGRNRFPEGFGAATEAIETAFHSHLDKHGVEPEGG